jgi:alanyl-tRNA synthetase
VLPAELPAAIERLQAESRELRRHLKEAQVKLAAHEADALAGAAETIGATRTVIAALDGWDAAGLKTIAASIAARPGHLAVLLSLPAPSAIVVARATDVAADSAAILKQMTATFGGKGGGRPELAQGGGLSGDPQALLAAARAAIAS